MLLWWLKCKFIILFYWYWCIILIFIFLLVVDFVYFYVLSLDGVMIFIVFMVRCGSVFVFFLFGVMVFCEKNFKSKVVDLVLVFIGMIFLYLGSW